MNEQFRHGPDILAYSYSLSKTRKENPKDSFSRNHELLVKAGFIRQEAAGIYSLLPLGTRVLHNIEGIIRDEMDSMGAQEIVMPSLQPKSVWEQTGRWNTIDVLFKLKSRWGDREYALGATTEEIVTPLVKDRINSYRDLPIAIYQIQKKHRDEKRAKSGIIRGREFGMKDMYSFHETYEDFLSFYQATTQAYFRIFETCGINAKITEASGGDYTRLSTHEFMAISDAGEDTIVYCPNCTFAQNEQIASYQPEDSCPKCNSALSGAKSIEIGHIFELGTKFSDDFGLQFTDREGQSKPVLMGCYGIGTTRLIGAIVELHNDEKGIIWPQAVSPYDFHLVGLGLDDPNVMQTVQNTIGQLSNMGFSVLFDDRQQVSAGEKFADADLIGIPTRLVISKKTTQSNTIEIKRREDGQEVKISPEEFFGQLNA